MTHRIIKLAWVLIYLLFLPPCSYGQAPLRIAYLQFPPFHWIDGNGEMKGFFYDIMTEALDKRMGVATVWTPYPWARCQENVKTGKDDALLTVPTRDRLVYTVTHPHPFYQKTLSLFTYRDHPRLAEIEKIKSLAGIRKGHFSVVTYSGNGWHKRHVQSLGIKTYESPYLDNVWKMLALKRGDLVLEWPRSAKQDLSRLELETQIVDTHIILARTPFHLLIRKDSPRAGILDEFEKTIAGMMADGTMAAILKRYD